MAGNIFKFSWLDVGRNRLLGLLAVAYVAMVVSPAHAAIEYADITGGQVKGEVSDGLATFKGLPFAAAPVGALRWRVPQPVVPWRGIRVANTFAPACTQPWGEPNPSREDCLYLNVWTAAASSKERLPVMVWIHGGGLKGGMSWERLSYGNHLAREGVVLVTIAYRLGAFGFLAHPELTRESGKSSGNYGLFDVIAALKWVQANIAQFGGDPTRVTIFGGSAGGFAVGLLAGAPAAKGLYARAIAQSGSGFKPVPKNNPERQFPPPHSLSSAEKDGQAFFQSLGLSDLKSARHVPAAAILRASPADERNAVGLAIIDGDLVQGFNIDLFEHHRFNDTPILVGFTSDEDGSPPGQTSADSVQAEIGRWPCEDPRTQAAMAAAYPHATDAQARTTIRHLYRDIEVAWPIWTWARLETTRGRNPAYVYVFDIHDDNHPFGAPHASEYPYVFGNFPKTPEARDEAVSELMRKYWVNFATRGDPNGPGLPVWERFGEQSQAAMVFDERPGSRPLPNLEGLRALDGILGCTQ